MRQSYLDCQKSLKCGISRHLLYISHLRECSKQTVFSVGVSDFLDWLEDLAPGMPIEHIVEDNITSHLDKLSDIGCSETEQSSRLCAIDLFLTSISVEVPELARIPRSGYGKPCAPLLIVENSSENVNFVGVYIDFLMSHTNRKTRVVYAQGLRKFCDWIVNQSKRALSR